MLHKTLPQTPYPSEGNSSKFIGSDSNKIFEKMRLSSDRRCLEAGPGEGGQQVQRPGGRLEGRHRGLKLAEEDGGWWVLPSGPLRPG